MLETFRENARSWIIQVLIAAIAVVFIFSFGPASNGCGQSTSAPTWAATVNGESLPASAFDSAFSQQVQFQRQMRGGSYTLDDARADDLRAKTLKELVDRELIAQAGTAQGLWVSDEEVAKEIRDISLFQKNGAFDPETYRRYVTNYEGTTPRKFEERIRRELLAQKSLELALGVVSVSEDEITAEYAKSEESASIAYVRLTPAQFKAKVEASESEIDAVLASRADEIKKRYDENTWRWLQPKGIKARRIFEPLAVDATPEQDAAAKKKVEEALAALESGKSWKEVVAGFSADPAAQGSEGEVGWVELGRSPFGRAFEEETFKLEPGKRSGLVRDRFGYQIIEALEVRASTEKKFDEVKRELAKELAQESKSKELALAAANEALQKLKAGQALSVQFPKRAENAPLSTTPEAAETDVFHPYGGFIPGIGVANKLSAAVFALDASKKLPEAPVEDGNNIYVFELTSRARADLSKLDDAQKNTLRERLVAQKKAGLQKTWVEQLRSDAKIKENKDILSYEIRNPYAS